MSSRRLILVSSCAALCALAAKRAHATDPSDLTLSASTGAHDAHVACGPDVRVRHASGGVHYERLFEEAPGTHRGMSLDVRAGVGTTTITAVSGLEPAPGQPAVVDSAARQLADRELGRAHALATGQVLAGWDWRTFALRGGVGYFGLADLSDGSTTFRPRYYALPALDMRIGLRRSGFRGNLGFGAPPIAGLTRWYALYGMGGYKFKEGGELGLGLMTTLGGVLDRRSGLIAHGAVPITDRVQVGAFGMVGSTDGTRVGGLDWTTGLSVRVALDGAEN